MAGRPKVDKTRCKIGGCEAVSLGSRYSRLCQAHYDADAAGSRGVCQRKGCKLPRCMPFADGFCDQHHLGKAALTSHENVMMQARLAGKTVTEIAAQMGHAPSTKGSAVSAALNKPSVRAAVELAGAKIGLTTESTMRTILDAQNANKMVLTRDAETGEQVPVPCGPDWDARLRGVEQAAKVIGMYAPTKTETDVTTHNQTLVILPPVSTIGLDHPVKILEVKSKEGA